MRKLELIIEECKECPYYHFFSPNCRPDIEECLHPFHGIDDYGWAIGVSISVPANGFPEECPLKEE